MILSIILLISSSLALQEEIREIYLSGKGLDNEKCSSAKKPCNTIKYALDLLMKMNSTNTSNLAVQFNIMDV